MAAKNIHILLFSIMLKKLEMSLITRNRPEFHLNKRPGMWSVPQVDIAGSVLSFANIAHIMACED